MSYATIAGSWAVVTALILARVFGNSPDFWLNVQRRSDLWDLMKSPAAAADRTRETSRCRGLMSVTTLSTGTPRWSPRQSAGRTHSPAGTVFRSAALALDSRVWNDVDSEVRMATTEKVDWSDCPLVEVKPGVQSGAVVLRGTRMPADAIVDNFDYGVSPAEIAEQFQISPQQVEAILTYAQSHRLASAV